MRIWIVNSNYIVVFRNANLQSVDIENIHWKCIKTPQNFVTRLLTIICILNNVHDKYLQREPSPVHLFCLFISRLLGCILTWKTSKWPTFLTYSSLTKLFFKLFTFENTKIQVENVQFNCVVVVDYLKFPSSRPNLKFHIDLKRD